MIGLLIIKEKDIGSVHNLIFQPGFWGEPTDLWTLIVIIFLNTTHFSQVLSDLIDFSLYFKVFPYGLNLIETQLFPQMKCFQLMSIQHSGDGTFQKQYSFWQIKDIELFFHLLFTLVILNSGFPLRFKTDHLQKIMETLDDKAKEVVLFESFSFGGVLGFKEGGT